MHWKKTLTTFICFTTSSLLYSVDVTDSTDLQAAIIAANAGGDGTINFTTNIDLTLPFGAPNLRPVNVMTNFIPTAFPITINGNSNQLNGGSAFRGFFVRGGNVALNNIVFSQTASFGGNGGLSGGGGGGGIGGALIVGKGAKVTATNCIFQSSTAQGGAGGGSSTADQFGSGGGGGLVGPGGFGTTFGAAGGGGLDHSGGSNTPMPGGLFSGGGGGGVGFDGNPETASPNPGGDGGGDYSGANGGAGGVAAATQPPRNGMDGGPGGGGGGGSQCCNDGFCDCNISAGKGGNGGIGGGGGGGGAGSDNTSTGGMGGDFGGGGGGNDAALGGAGGFCGGGGCGGVSFTTPNTHGIDLAPGVGGAGGFGGGAGGGGGAHVGSVHPGGLGGLGGFGGGNGDQGFSSGPSSNGYYPNGAGGGGAGFGGAIFIQNGGALTLKGSVSFSGNSVMGGAGGGPGSAAGADIFMMSGGSLTFDISQNVSIPNPIEGDQGAGGGSTTAGGLLKQGCALLTLNGANTYTGTTVVDAGELRINGSVVTDIEVEQNAILSGNFTIKKNTAGTNNGDLINAGIVSPGVGGVGQISLEGNFVNEPTGILIIDITPNGSVHDSLLVGGMATLHGGILDVVVNAGNYIAGTQYVIVNAHTNGQFAQVIQSGVNADLIDIDVTYSSVILTVASNFIFENQTISGSVQNAVADCIRTAAITPRSDFAIIVEQLGLLSDTEVNRALLALSPVNYGALDWINARNNNYVADILSQHLFELCCSPRDCCSCNCNTGIWIDVFGNLMDNKKHFDHLSPFEANAVGVITGIDYCFCQNYTIGAAVGYTHTWLDWRGHRGEGEINSYYGALYGSYQGCCLNIDLSAIGGGSDHDLKRKININETATQTVIDTNPCGNDSGSFTSTIGIDINRSAKSDLWGYFFTGHLGLSADWDWCCATFEPFALVDYNYFHREGFKEHGAESLDLHVKEHHQNMLRGEAGLRAYYTWVCDCYCVAPYIGGSWVGEFPLDKSEQRASFVGQDCVFDVTSYHSSVQLGSGQAGIKWTRNSGFSFLIGYKGLFNRKTTINEAEARLEWIF